MDQPQRHRDTEMSRFGGVAKRRTRPDSDESTNHSVIMWFVDSSDPTASASLLRGPAAQPTAFSLRLL